jgi:cytochrome c6
MLKKFIAACLSAVLLVGILSPTPGLAANLENGKQVFAATCSGCHANGGNIVRRNKTLKLKALEQNGYATVAAITQIVLNGKNNMPAYKTKLTAPQIEDVSTYVLDQAKKGWKK